VKKIEKIINTYYLGKSTPHILLKRLIIEIKNFKFELKEIVELIDKQWDEVLELIPCKNPCARDVEETFRRVKALLGKEGS